MLRRHLLAAVAILALTGTVAIAQTNPSRACGTIVVLDGNVLTFTSRPSEALPMMLNNHLAVAARKKVDLTASA